MAGQSAIKISNSCKLWKCHVHDKGSILGVLVWLLVNSYKRFSWVIRTDLVCEKEEKEVPKELVEGTRKRMYMVAGLDPIRRGTSPPCN